MTNDCKWLEREQDLPFTPYPGLTFDGLAGPQPLKISGMSYDISDNHYKLRLAWLSPDPMDSEPMIALNVGWKVRQSEA